MSELATSPLSIDWADYSQFVAGIQKIHYAAALETNPEFTAATMRHSNEDGTHFYFPHPADKDELLRYTHKLALDGDDVQRSLVIPEVIIAGHLFGEGNGRASRRAHALLAGKSADEIEQMYIDGARFWVGTDTEAHNIIDLRPPEAIGSHLEAYVYETTGQTKEIDLSNGFAVTNESAEAYGELRDSLPEKYRKNLNETVIAISSFRDGYFVRLEDAESVSYALNVQRPDADGSAAEHEIDLTATLASLGRDGLLHLVDGIWQYRLLRAKATIGSLAHTAIGLRPVSLPDHQEPLPLRDHFIRLSNNLVKDRA